MTKLHIRHLFFATIIVAFIAIAALLFSASPRMQAKDLQSPAYTFFTCTPSNVATFTDRVHVRCTTGAQPNNKIFYFSYCSTKDSAQASRFLSVFTTAKATGKNLGIYYNQTDLSGASCGCSTSDCRVIAGAEVRP